MRQIVLLTVLMSVLAFQSLEASPLTQLAQKSESKENANTVLGYLKPILKSEGKVARIYYSGSCEKEGDYYMVSFPRVRADLPLRKSGTGLAAIREVFRNDPRAKVSEGADGIVRIVIGQPPATILDTKISIVTFDQDQQYTESLALTRIQSSKEVQKAKRTQGVHLDGTPLYMSAVKPPTAGAPHLNASMVNLTLDQALDSVAQTFGGIVLYGACAAPHLYTIRYVSLTS